MPSSHATKRLTPDALGMKTLITTTSLAVTLCGWAVLAAERPQAPVEEAPIADAVAIQPPLSEFQLNLALLPTIVPAPPPPPTIVIDTPQPAARVPSVARRPVIQVAAPSSPAAQPVAPALPAAQPAPAVQQAPAVSQPLLRVVSAPPKPVTRTHSSR